MDNIMCHIGCWVRKKKVKRYSSENLRVWRDKKGFVLQERREYLKFIHRWANLERADGYIDCLRKEMFYITAIPKEVFDNGKHISEASGIVRSTI